MSEFEFKSLCILGRQPQLGLAELESLYGAEHIKPLEDAALLDLPAEEINFKRLGGTIKVARILTTLDSTDWNFLASYLKDKIPHYLQTMPEGKFTLGVSLYGLPVDIKRLNQKLLAVKKSIKATGRPVRIVPNKAAELNSAQVLHNKLTHKGAWELLLVRHGNKTILAQTLFVQDIDAYAARDQARPKRDARVGMLPPKLAQIIINLTNPPTDSTVLDPFCGTGVILQEALLMGYSAYGTDIEPRMVDYTKQNIDWLRQKHGDLPEASFEIADACDHKWPNFDFVASEVFLGRPLGVVPMEDKLQEIINDANTVIRKFLRNLAPQLKPGQTLCLAVPAWRTRNGLRQLPVLDAFDPPKSGSASILSSAERIDQLTDMGYTYLDLKHVRREQLIYYRKDQVVARQLIRLKKA